MKKYFFVFMLMGLAAGSQADIVLSFETEEEMPQWQGPITRVQHPVGVTDGQWCGEVRLDTENYWGLQWNAPDVSVIGAGTLTMDVTMIASEWPGGNWTNLGQAIACLSDGLDGWVEYNPIDVIDRTTGLSIGTSGEWGPWMGDAEWTLVYDTTGYDLTGATYFSLMIATNASDPYPTGPWYLDNIHIPEIPEPATLTLIGLGGLVLRRRKQSTKYIRILIYLNKGPKDCFLDPLFLYRNTIRFDPQDFACNHGSV